MALEKKGIPTKHFDKMYDQATRARSTEIRKRGLVATTGGLGLMSVGIIGLTIIFSIELPIPRIVFYGCVAMIVVGFLAAGKGFLELSTGISDGGG